MSNTPLTLEQALQKAVAHHQAGKLPQAERFYRAILQVKPTHADANHNLGVLLMGLNQADNALPFFKQALETCPQQTQFWFSYLEAFIQVNQYDTARSVLAQAREFGLAGEKIDVFAYRLSTPSDADLSALQTLLDQAHYTEAKPLAQRLTQNFPHQGSLWQALGEVWQGLGNLEESVAAKQKAVDLLPGDADALYNLGNGLRELQRFAEAETCYRQAIALNPNYEGNYLNLGITLATLHRLTEAEAVFRQLIHLSGQADVYYNLGNTLTEQGRLDEVGEMYLQAIALDPAHADAYNQLGYVFKQLGDFDQTEHYCQQVLAIQPNHIGAHNNLGNIFKDLGRLTEAEWHYRQAIATNADNAEQYNELGNFLSDVGRWDEAEQHYRRAMALNPDYADPYSNLATIFNALGRVDEAEAYLRQAIALNPHHADAHNNLANPLRDTGRLAEAEAHYRQAITIKPDHAIAQANLGNVLQELGQFDEAENYYRRALVINPNYAEACGNLLFSLNYNDKYAQPVRLAEARRYGELVAKKVKQKFATWLGAPSPEKLRVGLVSGDLCHHPVSYFLENLLAHVDFSRLEFIAYPTHRRNDEVTARLKPYFVDWKPLVDLRDEAAAQLIHDDGVHILLDLSGFTGHNRLPVFAWKPAPLQISWLGYWATTGVAEMDYILVDKIGVPVENQGQFTEKVAYLPDTRLCFSAPPFDIPVSTLPALSKGYVTFGCFQNASKITDAVLTRWVKLLARLPTAHLRFQFKQLRDAAFSEQFFNRLTAFGFDLNRVQAHSLSSREDYLRAYAEVDFVLDTFPFTGGTTTCEALWMGVPTLTLAGETLVARQGASLLSAAGLPDWIVDNEQAYIDKAIDFANNLDGLAALRKKLRPQVLASPLFDGRRFAKHFENTLWELWRKSP